MSVRVTAEDLGPEPRQETQSVEITNDFVIVCEGTCYVAHTAAHANGTVVLTIKGRKEA